MIIEHDGVLRLILDKGMSAYIDESSRRFVEGHEWRYRGGQAVQEDGLSLQRVIIGKAYTVRHLDGDRLNCRRSNMVKIRRRVGVVESWRRQDLL